MQLQRKLDQTKKQSIQYTMLIKTLKKQVKELENKLNNVPDQLSVQRETKEALQNSLEL